MRPPENNKYLLFGGTFVLANKLQFVGDKLVNGISTKQWFLLRNLLELGQDAAPTITQIAHEMDSTRQNITKMLEKMERDGFVAIDVNDSDHRSRSVRITELGKMHVAQSAENAQSFLDRLFDGITSEERDSAGSVMKKMVQNLEIMQEELDK
ncbi:MAG: MarR family winged helix-turn-helix transcriptional regulator [Lachnospiraceae bacterium]